MVPYKAIANACQLDDARPDHLADHPGLAQTHHRQAGTPSTAAHDTLLTYIFPHPQNVP